MLRADLLEPTDPRWPRALAGLRHDFYHLPAYVTFCSQGIDPGRPVAFHAEEDGRHFLLPLLIREIPDPVSAGAAYDATSTRGYPGPLWQPPQGTADTAFLDRAIKALKSTLREAGIISAFVRLHPLLALPPEVLRRHGTVVDHGEAVAVDLGEAEDEMWHMTEHGHRRDINKGHRHGLVVRMDEGWEHLDGLARAYAQSMARLGADERWHLSREYFSGLREALGARAHLCVVEDDGRLCAAAVLPEVDGIVEFHLSGTMDEYLRMSPSKMIIDFARRWAKARDDRILHLAGSTGRGDSLIRFKLGFSPLVNPVLSWRIVVDEAAYGAQVEARERAAGTRPDAADEFFPAYRKPTAGSGLMSRLDRIMRETLELDETVELSSLAYHETPQWDSVAHLSLLNAVEEAYGFELEPDELMAMTDYAGVRGVIERRVRDEGS